MKKLSSKSTNSIRYSQCWEDTELMLKALNIKQDDVVFSIASGGENVFALMTQTDNFVHAIDYNLSQIYIIKLKLAALKRLSFDDYIEFIGIKKSNIRIEIFIEISYDFSDDSKDFFLDNLEIIKKGIIHVGKLDKYLRIFSKYILPFFVSKSKIKKAVNSSNNEFRYKIFQKVWNNWRYRLLGEVFFGQKVMQKTGRHEVMFKYNDEKKTGAVYLDRAKKFLSKGAIHQNPYMDYILSGNYHNNLHFYLQKQNFDKLKRKNNVEFHHSDILSYFKSMPDDCFDKFNLSDVFESMNVEETNVIFEEILRVSKPNARLIFWNNLVIRDVPENLKLNFVQDIELEEKLKPSDKVFFYERFYIYKIEK